VRRAGRRPCRGASGPPSGRLGRQPAGPNRQAAPWRRANPRHPRHSMTCSDCRMAPSWSPVSTGKVTGNGRVAAAVLVAGPDVRLDYGRSRSTLLTALSSTLRLRPEGSESKGSSRSGQRSSRAPDTCPSRWRKWPCPSNCSGRFWRGFGGCDCPRWCRDDDDTRRDIRATWRQRGRPARIYSGRPC